MTGKKLLSLTYNKIKLLRVKSPWHLRVLVATVIDTRQINKRKPNLISVPGRQHNRCLERPHQVAFMSFTQRKSEFVELCPGKEI